MRTPVAMPLLVRVIATVLIGLPGGLMWLAGLLGTTLSTIHLILSISSTQLSGLKLFAISLAALSFGYPMIAAVSWLNGSRHYRMPGHRLPASPLIWLTGIFLGFTTLAITMRMRKRHGNAWRDELLSGPEGASSLY